MAVVLDYLAKIEQKQDKYQSNFLNSSGVNENDDAPEFVSGTSSCEGQKELLEELSQLTHIIPLSTKVNPFSKSAFYHQS